MEKQTYIAFDAYGISDPVNSNWVNYRNLMAWQNSYPNRFHFNCIKDLEFAHTHPVMVESTLRPYLQKKMEAADNLMIMASPVLNVKSDILNWQIQHAVNILHLPIVVAYVGLSCMEADTIDRYRCWLPEKLVELIDMGAAKVAHIPFSMDKVERACKQFSKHDWVYPWTGKTIY